MTTRYTTMMRTIELLEAMPKDLPDEKERTLDVVRETGLTPQEFWELDEKPGRYPVYNDDGEYVHYYHANWHSRLRRLRNDPAYPLFEVLKANLEALA